MNGIILKNDYEPVSKIAKAFVDCGLSFEVFSDPIDVSTRLLKQQPEAIIVDVDNSKLDSLRTLLPQWSKKVRVVVLLQELPVNLTCEKETQRVTFLLKSDFSNSARLVNVLLDLLQSTREYAAVHHLQQQVDTAIGLVSGLRIGIQHG